MGIAESHGATVLLASEGKQDFAELIDCTAKLGTTGQLPRSGLLCQTWFSRNQSPYSHDINFNLDDTLGKLGDVTATESGRFQGFVVELPPPGKLFAGV